MNLWGASVSAKLKVFLWRLAQHSVPTLDVLNHRNMADKPHCPLCGALNSWRHSLIECPMARSVWALAKEDIVEHMIMTRITSAKLWLASMHYSVYMRIVLRW